MSLIRKVSEALTYNAIRIIISTMLSIAYSVVAIRWLKIQQFGGYIFLDSLFMIFATLYVLGTHAPMLRFIPELEAKEDYPRLRRLIFSSQIINLLGSSTATLLIFLSIGSLLEFLGKYELTFYARLLSIGIVPKAVLGILKNILNAVYEQKFLNFFETLSSFLNLIFMLMSVYVLNLGLTGIIITYLLSDSIFAVIYLTHLRKKHPYLFLGEQKTLGLDYVLRIIKYTAPLTAIGFISTINNYMSNLILGILKNIEDVAYFDIPNSFVDRILSEIWSVIGFVGVVSLSEINTSSPEKMSFALQQYVKIVSLYVFPVTIGGFILGESILIAFYGEQVIPSVPIFKILLIGYCFLNILKINNIILNVKEKTHLLLIGYIFRCIILIILNLELIPNLGALGAAISQLIASFVEMSYYTYSIMTKIRIHNFIPFKTLVKYFNASLIMGFIVVASTYLLETEMIFRLIIGLTIGPLAYAIALRLIGAFDQTDKHIIMNSKIPFKSIILKLLWKK